MATFDLKAKIAATPQAPGYVVGQLLPLASIRTDGGTQARAGVDDVTIQEYAHAMEMGAEFPLIVVFHDGEAYWLADGFHRAAAAQRIGRAELRAEIQSGTRRDAILYACGANASHGVRRTQADKRRAIERLLRDEEWRQWSDSEIARRAHVDHKTVANVRRDLYPGNSQDSRTVERSGTTYQQRTPAPKGAINSPDGSPVDPAPRIPDDLIAAGVNMQRHGAWWVARGESLLMEGYASSAEPWDLAVAAARSEIARRTKPNISEVAPGPVSPAVASGSTAITVITSGGEYQIVPLRTTAVLALHEAVGAQGWAITHIGTGRRVALFLRRLSADTAFDRLAALDWTELTPEGGTSPRLGVQVARILLDYEDVDRRGERWAALEQLEQRMGLEAKGWAFPPADKPKGFIKLEHPDLHYGRQEPDMAAAIRAARGIQSGFERRAELRQSESAVDQLTASMADALESEYGIPVEVVEDATPAPLDMDDAAYQAAIRAKARALGLELTWEDDDRVCLFWPGEDVEQIEPLHYGAALRWLDSEAQELAQHRAELTRNAPRRLTPGAHAQAVTLLNTIRTALITDQIAQAETHARQLLSIIEKGEVED